MRHGILCGEFELTIDEKNRLLIPSEIRNAIDPQRDGSAFFVIVGNNDKPWIYPDKYYEALISQAPSGFFPVEDLVEYDQMTFAMARRVEADQQGRILLPQKTLTRTGTQRSVTLIGARDRLEIWNRADWDEQFAVLRAKRKEVAARARSAVRPDAAPPR